MRICGIVAEYNPFHAGHERHITLTRKKTQADIIVCAMSASFVQRGEPAVFDKWTRAACALLCGADAVVELPLLYAIQSAEGFASGGIAILRALGANMLSFGSETEDIGLLTRAAQTFANETEVFRSELKKRLDEGLSFPSARMKAAFPYDAETLSSPNAILGVEYIKAIIKSGADILPFAIPRVGGAYHSADITAPLPSATALRAEMRSGQTDEALGALPPDCAGYIHAQLEAGLLPAFPERFDNALLYRLRTCSPEDIRSLHEVSEGLENRIYEAAQHCTTREQLIESVKTKRYTYTRISRILLYSLLGVTKDLVRQRNRSPIDHVRVLGVRSPEVLSALSQTSSVPLIAGSVASSPYPVMDIAASDIWALSQNKLPFCAASRDYTQKLLIQTQF